MGESHYQRSANTLRIWGSLDRTLDMQFDIALKALLDEAAACNLGAIIDLRDIAAIDSQYVAALLSAASGMKKCKRVLTIQARDRIGELLKQCGLCRLASLETE